MSVRAASSAGVAATGRPAISALARDRFQTVTSSPISCSRAAIAAPILPIPAMPMRMVFRSLQGKRPSRAARAEVSDRFGICGRIPQIVERDRRAKDTPIRVGDVAEHDVDGGNIALPQADVPTRSLCHPADDVFFRLVAEPTLEDVDLKADHVGACPLAALENPALRIGTEIDPYRAADEGRVRKALAFQAVRRYLLGKRIECSVREVPSG